MSEPNLTRPNYVAEGAIAWVVQPPRNAIAWAKLNRQILRVIEDLEFRGVGVLVLTGEEAWSAG